MLGVVRKAVSFAIAPRAGKSTRYIRKNTERRSGSGKIRLQNTGEDRESVQTVGQSLNQASKHVPPAELKIGSVQRRAVSKSTTEILLSNTYIEVH